MRIWPHFKRPHLALVQALWWMLGWVSTCFGLWICSNDVYLAIGVLMNSDSSNRWMYALDTETPSASLKACLECSAWLKVFGFWKFRVGHMPFTYNTSGFFRRWLWWPTKATQMIWNQSIHYSPCTRVFWVSAYTIYTTTPFPLLCLPPSD